MDKIRNTKVKHAAVYQLTREESITAIIDNSARAVELLAEYGIVCMNCILKQFDTLETGAQLHGMSKEEIDTMIEEINGQLRKEAK